MALKSQPTQAPGREIHEDNSSTETRSEEGQVPNAPANTPLTVDDSDQQTSLDWGQLDLATFMPQNSPFRVIVLPKVEGVDISAYGGNKPSENWAEVPTGSVSDITRVTKLFALAATAEHVGCRVTHHGTQFLMYFNVEHAHDHLVLKNQQGLKLYVTSLQSGTSEKVEKLRTIELTLGEWAISTSDGPLVEVKVLKRTHWPISPSLSTKRPAESAANSANKMHIPPHLGGVREETLERIPSTNDILSLRRGDSVRIGGRGQGYKLQRFEIISDNHITRVCRASHSGVPGRMVAIKIKKTANAGEDATVGAAERWLHETKILSSISGSHYAIANYFGCDARFHSIYTEYVNGKPLIDYRDEETCIFTGNIVRVWRILENLAAGLSFLHLQSIVHGDIKLHNIIYSPMRGAVLVDFSGSFVEGGPREFWGAPWYLPPEFLNRTVRHKGSARDMWALGVVIMWLLKRIPLPESTSKWDVEDLLLGESPAKANAQVKMSKWLSVVLEAKVVSTEDLDEIQGIVNGLLEPKEADRTDAKMLEQQIEASNHYKL